ncbi:MULTISPECIES: hypothetical protein [unclassified Microcoleus]|uniref:hypothetical protein n=1 Tax=unclassified Microcoleus TaxID=2642155 RepID=UPI002FCFD2BF
MLKQKRKSKKLQQLDDCIPVPYEPAALRRRPRHMTKEEWEIYKPRPGSVMWNMLAAAEGVTEHRPHDISHCPKPR